MYRIFNSIQFKSTLFIPHGTITETHVDNITDGGGGGGGVGFFLDCEDLGDTVRSFIPRLHFFFFLSGD